MDQSKSSLDIAIKQDDLADGNIVRLLQAHRRKMLKHSPPENVHALTTEQLQQPNLQFWSAWIQANSSSSQAPNSSQAPDLPKLFAGCGALKYLGNAHAELKSMKTDSAYLRQGIAQTLLEHIINAAKEQGITTISLETGSQDVFAPAKKLYLRNGFEFCGPFADYTANPLSTFMTRRFNSDC